MKNIDDTIKTMQKIVEEIKECALDKEKDVDEEKRNVVEAVANRTIGVINEASLKLKDAVCKITDETDIDAFLSRVEEKCLDAKRYAFNKFEEIVPNNIKEEDTKAVKEIEKDKIEEIEEEDTKTTLEESTKEIVGEVVEENKEIENLKDIDFESIINFLQDIKNSVIDFINKPETQQKYKETKLKVLKLIDSGLDKLLKVLDK